MKAGFRKAKIVCTIGPATRDPSVFHRLVEAGMDAARINFSHAGHDEAAHVVSMTRDAVRELGRPVAVIGDLQGPRIRVGDLPAVLPIRTSEEYCLVPEGVEPPEPWGPERTIPTTYASLADDLSPGDRILLDDGRLELIVRSIDGERVIAEARTDGLLASQKGLNLPGVSVRAPSVTEKDVLDLEFARAQHLDYVAQSFVRRPEDLEVARRSMDPGSLLIAKIERAQALERLSEILPLSDGVMVARGDLGVELPYEEVPMQQKRIIRLAQRQARPVITATQMLESMVANRRPTRAEVSDVANALLDGTDAVMLSSETAVGEYPVEAIQTMDRIVRRIEQEQPGLFVRAAQRLGDGATDGQQTTSGAVAAAAIEAVERLEAPFLVTFTRSGYTARIVAAQRPPVPILAVSDQWRTFNQLALVWGVHPILFRGDVSYRSMLARAVDVALGRGLGKAGERIVVTAGVPFHVTGTTNMMRIEEL